MCPKDYLPALLEWIDIENIPEYLGGKSHGTLVDDLGPWKDPEHIRALAADQVSTLGEEEEEEALSVTDDGSKFLSASGFGDVVLEEHSTSTPKDPGLQEEPLFLTDPPKSNRSPLLPSAPDQTSPTPSSPSAISRTKALTGR